MCPCSSNHYKNTELICWNRRGQRNSDGKLDGGIVLFFHSVCFFPGGEHSPMKGPQHLLTETGKILQVLEWTSLDHHNSLTAGGEGWILTNLSASWISPWREAEEHKSFSQLSAELRGQSPNSFPVIVLRASWAGEKERLQAPLMGQSSKKRWQLPYQQGMSPLWHCYHSASSLFLTPLPLSHTCCWELYWSASFSV